MGKLKTRLMELLDNVEQQSEVNNHIAETLCKEIIKEQDGVKKLKEYFNSLYHIGKIK